MYKTNQLIHFNNVVAIGGGHGLGRVMSSLGFLGHRLKGIVTTTDNGGSTGRIRRSQGGIAWGDMRNCLNQLITSPSIATEMFEYRFKGEGELGGHNLGNLMLTALNDLSVRPLMAINLIRRFLKISPYLFPMSELPTHLLARNKCGEVTYGETNIDQLDVIPEQLELSPVVPATKEAIQAINMAELILIGPGSFFTSILPPLLLPELSSALMHTQAIVVYIENLSHEMSLVASQLTMEQKINLLHHYIGKPIIQAAIVDENIKASTISLPLLIKQQSLAAQDIPYRHDRKLLRSAIEDIVTTLLDGSHYS